MSGQLTNEIYLDKLGQQVGIFGVTQRIACKSQL